MDNESKKIQKNNKIKNKIIEEFIDHLWLEDGLSKNTLNSYRFDLELFSEWLTKTLKKNILDVSQADIQLYLSFKFPTSKARSISRLLATLRRLFRYLLRENKVKVDPTLEILSPKIPKSLPQNQGDIDNVLEDMHVLHLEYYQKCLNATKQIEMFENEILRLVEENVKDENIKSFINRDRR